MYMKRVLVEIVRRKSGRLDSQIAKGVMAMNARTVSTMMLVLVLIWLMASCQIENGQDSTEVTEILNEDIWNCNALNGYKGLVTLAYTDVSNAGSTTGFKETLRVYQQSASTPEDLVYLGSVYLGVNTLYHRVTDLEVNADWVVVTINHNDDPEGYVSLVAVGGGPPFSLDAFYTFIGQVDKAYAYGSYLLVVQGSSLTLFDITNLDSPISKGVFTVATSPQSFVGTSTGFLVILETGLGVVDVSDPQNLKWTESAHLDIGNSKKAYLYDDVLYLAGPSKNVGKIKILKIDLQDIYNPVIQALRDDIAGSFVDFSYDDMGHYYLIDSTTVHDYMRAENTFNSQRLADFYLWPRANSCFHASREILYALRDGFTVYKFAD